MLRISNCVVLVNHKSGNGHAKKLFEYILQEKLKRAGIPFSIVEVPTLPIPSRMPFPRAAAPAALSSSLLPSSSLSAADGSFFSSPSWMGLMKEPAVKALVLCGGDGTLHHVANALHRAWYRSHLCAAGGGGEDDDGCPRSSPVRKRRSTLSSPDSASSVSFASVEGEEEGQERREREKRREEEVKDEAPFWEKPIVLLPAGVHNTVAYHVGITSPEQSIVSFSLARPESIRVWEIRRVRVQGGGGGGGEWSGLEMWKGEIGGDPQGSSSLPSVPPPPPRCAFISHLVCGVLVEQWWCYHYWREEWNRRLALPTIDATTEAFTYPASSGGGGVDTRASFSLPKGFMSGGGTFDLVSASSSSSSFSLSPLSPLRTLGIYLLRFLSTAYALYGTARERRVVWCDISVTIADPRPSPSTPPFSSSSSSFSSPPPTATRINRHDLPHTSTTFQNHPPPPPPSSSTHDSSLRPHDTRECHLKGPFQLVVASPFPSQGASCWLTPTANPRAGKLTVVVVTEEASSLRLWHLLRREAPTGDILEEDGVHLFSNVIGMEMIPHSLSSRVPEQRKRRWWWRGGGDVASCRTTSTTSSSSTTITSRAPAAPSGITSPADAGWRSFVEPFLPSWWRRRRRRDILEEEREEGQPLWHRSYSPSASSPLPPPAHRHDDEHGGDAAHSDEASFSAGSDSPHENERKGKREENSHAPSGSVPSARRGGEQEKKVEKDVSCSLFHVLIDGELASLDAEEKLVVCPTSHCLHICAC